MIFAQCNGTIKLEQIKIVKEEVEMTVLGDSIHHSHALEVCDSIHQTVSYTQDERDNDLQNLPLGTAHVTAVGEYQTACDVYPLSLKCVDLYFE